MKISQQSPAELTGAKAPNAASKAGAAAPAGRSAESPAAQAATAAAPSAPAATAVTVSNLARSLEPKAAAATAGVNASQPDFDAKKVAEVRAAIAQGTYKIDAGAIADKLLSNAQQLLRRNSDA
ncbi:MAG: flagellar biosynthesis anti-sigma factor FlgM [Xylophilus ampelinus]